MSALYSSSTVIPELRLTRKTAFLITAKARFKVLYGGRGSLKSWTIARVLLTKALTSKLRILCAREYQKSIKDSVHQLLREQIELLGYSAAFEIKETSIVCKTTGSVFFFAGLHFNVNGIKSMEGIDICWVEEAETVSAKSWRILEPTIRKKGSEIWVSFNPRFEDDPTYQRFVVHPAPGTISQELSWKDNPWLTNELLEQAEYMRVHDPENYAHIWGGGTWTRNDAQIFNGRWAIEDFDPYERDKAGRLRPWVGPFYGSDFGFARDPSVAVKLWILKKRLYIEYAEFRYGLVPTLMPEKLYKAVPGMLTARNHYADCARPETIAQLNLQGMPVVGCTKWSGSVEDGIEHLRGYEKIIIHSRCRDMQQEALHYSYKVDKRTEAVLPEVVDAHNHGWDATRYALQPLIMPRVPPSRRAVAAGSRFT